MEIQDALMLNGKKCTLSASLNSDGLVVDLDGKSICRVELTNYDGEDRLYAQLFNGYGQLVDQTAFK